MLCKVSVILAYIAAVYILSSVIYLVVTNYFKYSPFKEALKKYPELKKIKEESASFRRKVFYSGVGVSIILLILIKPFSKC